MRDAEWAERIHTWCTPHGSIAGPMEVWLADRSLTTLSVRLERQCFNAQAIAEYLAARTEVLSVRYPGSPTDPTHAITE